MCPARGWGGIRPGTPELRVLLRGVSSQSPPPARLCWVPLSPGPGMCRWSLHKKVERDPGKSPALVRILLRELEKVGSRVWGRQTVAAGGGGGREARPAGDPGPSARVLPLAHWSCPVFLCPLDFSLNSIIFTGTPTVGPELISFKNNL